MINEINQLVNNGCKFYSYIRFSSSKQHNTHSYSRQKKLSRQFCESFGVTIESTTFEDLGVSGHSGEHIKTGMLAEFKQCVLDGKIKPGSALVVENFDRLGRLELTESVSWFLSIIKLHITVITLDDMRLYNKESIRENDMSLMGSLMVKQCGYEILTKDL